MAANFFKLTKRKGLILLVLLLVIYYIPASLFYNLNTPPFQTPGYLPTGLLFMVGLGLVGTMGMFFYILLVLLAVYLLICVIDYLIESHRKNRMDNIENGIIYSKKIMSGNKMIIMGLLLLSPYILMLFPYFFSKFVGHLFDKFVEFYLFLPPFVNVISLSFIFIGIYRKFKNKT
jgi:hypothetical protein